MVWFVDCPRLSLLLSNWKNERTKQKIWPKIRKYWSLRRRKGIWRNKTQLIECELCARLVAQSCLTLCDPMDCSLLVPLSSVLCPLSSLLCLWVPLSMRDSPGKNTGVCYHALFQGIFPTQGLNPSLLHCRWILYHLSYQGSWMRINVPI